MSLAPFCEVAPEKRLSLVLHTQLLVLAILVLEISVPIPAPAQILYGGLLGDATDESGAVLINARATAVNVETGVVREVSANESGMYHFPTLPPGLYRLEVRAAGFRTFLRTGVRITSNATVRVNAVLALGDVTESVTVASDQVELQTEGAQVRRELSQNTFNSVPIPLGRNYQLLLGTLPGISPPQNANSLAANPSRAVVYSVNGASHHGNNVRIDGATSNNPNVPHNTALNPTLESIDMVNIVTNSFDAEQGLAGGAAVNVQIKSGTNALHGSAFWYHNDQAISAYPYFSDRSQSKPKFISNQFGATAGGPIKRNRAFFFVSYERTNEHSNATRYLTVPTAALRQGDMTRSPAPIFDPLTGALSILHRRMYMQQTGRRFQPTGFLSAGFRPQLRRRCRCPIGVFPTRPAAARLA